MIRIGHLNIHNEKEALDVALGWGCDSLGLNEANRLRRRIQRNKDYNSFHSPYPKDKRRGSSASPILVRKDIFWSGALGLLLSDASEPERFAPDRFVTGAFYRKDGVDIAHFNFHNHALTDNRTSDVDRVKQAAQGVRGLHNILRMAKALKFQRVLTGDLNTHDDAGSPGWKDIGEVLAKEGMFWRNVSVDWMAWDPEVLGLDRFRTISRRKSESDHRGLIADFYVGQ